MDAGTLSIKNIFGQDRRHIVPLFQRPYVWKRDLQWEPFWDDIRNVAERVVRDEKVVPHFLGAIVLDQMLKPTGHIETRWVIDGQQRLTTIQLFLEAFADICEELGQVKHYKALRKLTRNDDPMSEDDDEEFKVWPTNIDQESFRRVMRAVSPTKVKALYGRSADTHTVGHPIADAYLYFHDEVIDWLSPDEDDYEERLKALYTTMREHIRMVVIDLGAEDDPQLIFETLNARGTPLLPSDLVKNFLFHRAKLEGRDLQPLYEQFWKPFDENDKYWRAQLGRGHAQRARIDLFLQYYLTARTGSDVPVGRLYTMFREYASDGASEGAHYHLALLQRYSTIHRSFDHLNSELREALFFERLQVMGTMTAYPFLLELFDRYGSDRGEVLAVLVDVESFLVRRMVCQMNTRGYNRLFVELVNHLKEEDGSPSARVREFLLGGEAESTRWPRDDEFRRAWLGVPLYRLSKGRLRMILEALERQLFTSKTEKIEFKETLTIEHLMPQSWHEHWPLPDDKPRDEAQTEREQHLHRIGNLTLLTRKLNPSVSNGPWLDKREAILEHSSLSLNRRLRNIEEWNEETIRQRGNALFEIVRQVWPCPDN